MNKLIFLFACLLICTVTFAQNESKDRILAKATADSSYIAINKRAGWQMYSSYLTPIKSDSVTIEMIVQHDRTIDWKQEQLVGCIKSTSLFPKTSQTVSFNLMSDIYQLRIEPNGQCYLWLASGSLPDGDLVIIPVRAVYKL